MAIIYATCCKQTWWPSRFTIYKLQSWRAWTKKMDKNWHVFDPYIAKSLSYNSINWVGQTSKFWKIFAHSQHDRQCYNHNGLFSGTPAYDKLKMILTKKPLLNAIGKLSPDAQTSCFEGFHSTLNQWHPKIFGFSWQGTFCRHANTLRNFIVFKLKYMVMVWGILVNAWSNLIFYSKFYFLGMCLQVSTSMKIWTGNPNFQKLEIKYYRVTYPKFKLGEEVARDVPVPPTYCKSVIYVSMGFKFFHNLRKIPQLSIN